MSTAFENLIAEIEREARDEGPRAVRELEQFRDEFKLAAAEIGSSDANMRSRNNLGNKLSETEKNSETENPANTGSIH
ncbi:MAG: hypothetical protein ACRDK4_02620 [Solirubrobacteraceae bacterium]